MEDPAIEGVHCVTMAVYESEQHHIATGLLNAAGEPLYRVERRNPIGFDLTIKKDCT